MDKTKLWTAPTLVQCQSGTCEMNYTCRYPVDENGNQPTYVAPEDLPQFIDREE